LLNIEIITHPKEKIEERPKIFLIFFCFTLPTLPSTTLKVPNKNTKGFILFMESRIRGINFCQIERTQISPQLNFWIIFKYQN
jgi:hypothetical protein